MSFEKEVRFEIVKQIGVLATHSTGWSKELNLVSWNGGAPKFDIRDWSPDHKHMSRGAAFTPDEMAKVIELVNGIAEKGREIAEKDEAAADRKEPAKSMTKPKKNREYER